MDARPPAANLQSEPEPSHVARTRGFWRHAPILVLGMASLIPLVGYLIFGPYAGFYFGVASARVTWVAGVLAIALASWHLFRQRGTPQRRFLWTALCLGVVGISLSALIIIVYPNTQPP